MSGKRIAVAGGGGFLGTQVVQALVNASYPVTILTRSTKPQKFHSPSTADVEYAIVDYDSVKSLFQALEGHYGLVSTVTSTSVGGQMPLIEAAVAAGVKRFLPAEFGADMDNALTSALPVFRYKAVIGEKLKEVVATTPDFSYTLIRNGMFLEWAIQMAFLLDVKNRSVTLFDGGDRKFSTTTLATVGKAVVGVFEHLEETKNRAVYVHDVAITQKELVDLVKNSDPAGREWTVKTATIAETKDKAIKVLSENPTPEEMGSAMVQLIYPSVLGKEYGGDISAKTDNALLNIKEMSHAELEQAVAIACSQLW